MNREELVNLPIEWKRGSGLSKSDLKEDGKNKCILYGELYTKHKKLLITSSNISRTNKIGTIVSKRGDILIPGTSTASKKDMLLAREIDEDGVFLGGDINIIRPSKGLFAKKYLPYYFETLSAFDQLDKYITGATGIIHLSNTGIKKLKVPLPSFQEQQRIVSILDEAFDAIEKAKENAEKNLKNSRELFKSYLQGVFENKCERWEKKKLGDVCSLYQGIAINSKTKHALVEKSDLPLLRIKDLKNNTVEQYIDPNNYPTNALVNQEDIIYTRTGSLGLVFKGKRGVLHNNAFKVVPNSKITNDYLFHWLQNPAFKAKIMRLALKAAQPDITHAIFKTQEISIPSIEDQNIIVEKIDALRSEIQKLEAIYQKKIQELEELKKSFLQKAFRGELKTN